MIRNKINLYFPQEHRSAVSLFRVEIVQKLPVWEEESLVLVGLPWHGFQLQQDLWMVVYQSGPATA